MAIKQEREEKNKKTCLYERHVEAGAFMTPFAGFIMPIHYKDIQFEHKAVRHIHQ